MSATFERSAGPLPREIPHLPRRAPRRTPRRVPWPPLIALCLLALIGVVALLPTVREDPVQTLATRALQVQDQADGAVVIRDAETGAVAGTIPAGGDSFVRGVLHGTEVSRRLYGVSQSLPYRLTALSNGRLTLTDAATRTTIDLVSFGSTNARSFALLLGVPDAHPRAPAALPAALPSDRATTVDAPVPAAEEAR